MAREAWCKGKHASMHAYQEGKFCFDEISRVFSSKSISFTKKKRKKLSVFYSLSGYRLLYIWNSIKINLFLLKKNWLSMQSRI